MYLHNRQGIKRKLLRSFARVYGENLKPRQKYSDLKPVICIAFMNGPVRDVYKKTIKSIHSLFHVMERDTHKLLLTDLEMHFIDLKSFVKKLEEDLESQGYSNYKFDSLTKWLMLITAKVIKNKDAIRTICEEGEIKSAMKTLLNLSNSKYKRQAYQRSYINLSVSYAAKPNSLFTPSRL